MQETILSLGTSIRDLKQQIDELKDSMSKLDKESQLYATSADKLDDLQNQFNEAVKKSISTSEEYTGTLEQNLKLYAEQKEEISQINKAYKDGEMSVGEYMKRTRELKVASSELNITINAQQKLANAASGSYQETSQQLGLMRTALRQMNDEEKNSTGGRQLAETIQVLDEQLKKADADMGNFQRNVGNYAIAGQSLKSELKELQTEMANMLMNGAQPTDEAFQKLVQRAGTLKDAMADAKAVTSQYADDAQGLSTVVDIANSATAAFGAWKGAAQLLGIENEGVNKTIATMTTVTATLNSLKTLQIALTDKQSATYRIYHTLLQALNIEKKKEIVGETEATAAAGAETAAIGAQTAATGAATVATKLFSAALKAIGIGLVIAAVAALVEGLVWLNDKFNIVGKTIDGMKKGFQAVTDWLGFTSEAEREQAKAAEEARIANEKYQKTLDEIAKQAQSSMHSHDDLIANLLKYDKVISDTTKSNKERLSMMKKVNEETGKEIFNLKDEKKALNDCGGAIKAYIQNLYKEMQVQALLAKAAHDYVNIIMLEENVKKAGGNAPETKKQIENHKKNIEAYKAEAEEIAKGIKVYNDYNTTKATTTRTTTEHTKKEENLTDAYKKQLEAIKNKYAIEQKELKLKKELNKEGNKGGLFDEEQLKLEIQQIEEIIKLYEVMVGDKKLTKDQIANASFNLQSYRLDRDTKSQQLTKKQIENIGKEIADAIGKSNTYFDKAFQNIDNYIRKGLLELVKKEFFGEGESAAEEFKNGLKKHLKEAKLTERDSNEIAERFSNTIMGGQINSLLSTQFPPSKLIEMGKKFGEEYYNAVWKGVLGEINDGNKNPIDFLSIAFENRAMTIGKSRELWDKQIKDIFDNINKEMDFPIFPEDTMREADERLNEINSNILTLKSQFEIIDNNLLIQLSKYKIETESVKKTLDEITKEGLSKGLSLEQIQNTEEYQKAQEELNAKQADLDSLQIDAEIAKSDILKQLWEEEANFYIAMQNKKEERQKRNIEVMQKFADNTASIMNSVAQVWQDNYEMHKESGEKTEEELRKEFERIKAMQIASTVVSMISAGVGAWFEDMKNPAYQTPPFLKYVMAASDMATILATGWAQINQIKNTKFDGAGSGGAGSHGVASVAVSPLLNNTLDTNSLTQLQTEATAQSADARVYVVESDITDTQNKVAVREENSTF